MRWGHGGVPAGGAHFQADVQVAFLGDRGHGEDDGGAVGCGVKTWRRRRGDEGDEVRWEGGMRDWAGYLPPSSRMTANPSVPYSLSRNFAMWPAPYIDVSSLRMEGCSFTIRRLTSLPDASSSNPNAQTKVRVGLNSCSISAVMACL